MATRKPKEPQQKTDLPLAERHVSMSNALARASHGLTLAEKRVIACGLASTDSKSARFYNEVMRYGSWVVRIPALDFAEWAGIEPQTAYTQLADAATSLLKRQWTITNGKSISRFNWLSRAEYHKGEGWVEVEFTQHTAPHVLALLKGNFTSYRLEQTAALRSGYSWRLLECLQSWKDTGRWMPTVEEFCHAMDAPKSCRIDFGQLRRRVIEPAVHELRQKDNMVIEWDVKKAGRKVTGLDFKFQPNPQQKLDF